MCEGEPTGSELGEHLRTPFGYLTLSMYVRLKCSDCTVYKFITQRKKTTKGSHAGFYVAEVW